MTQFPQTIEAARKLKYGHNHHARKFIEGQCAAEVTDNSTRWTHYHQCSNKPGKGPSGLYCGQHAAAATAAGSSAKTETWYRLNYSCTGLVPFEVSSFTEKTLVLKGGRKERRDHSQFQTPEKGMTYLCEHWKKTVENAHHSWENALRNLATMTEAVKSGKPVILKNSWE